MIRRPPRSTLDRSSAASDVYKRQVDVYGSVYVIGSIDGGSGDRDIVTIKYSSSGDEAVSYTHLLAHETVLDLLCRLLLEKKNTIYVVCR